MQGASDSFDTPIRVMNQAAARRYADAFSGAVQQPDGPSKPRPFPPLVVGVYDKRH